MGKALSWGSFASAAFISWAAATGAEAQSPAHAPLALHCTPAYAGKLVLEADGNGRTMTLQQGYAYTDAACHNWRVPAGAAVDGASIPSFLWSFIGGPFEGLYRNASVVHDWFCSVRTEQWRAVHRMFYDAMITSGVSPRQAKLLYLGVYYGGPRWDELTIRNSRHMLTMQQRQVTETVKQTIEQASRTMAAGDAASVDALLVEAEQRSSTPGDRYLVYSAQLQQAARTGNSARQAAAIDGMIASDIAPDRNQSVLLAQKALIAYRASDYAAAGSAARQALVLAPDNQPALETVNALKAKGLDYTFPEFDTFKPDPVEFRKLEALVEQDDKSLAEIDALVDRARRP